LLMGTRLVSRITWRDFVLVLVSALSIAFFSSFYSEDALYKAVLVATPPIYPQARLVVADNLSSLAKGITPIDKYRHMIGAAYISLFAKSFWVSSVLVSVFLVLMLYPLLRRLYIQLPVLIYRVGSTPLGLSLRVIMFSILVGLAITLQPFIALLLVITSHGLLPVHEAFSSLSGYLVLLALLPSLISSLYLYSGRFDITVVSSIVYSAVAAHLVSSRYAYAAYALLVLIVSILVYLIHLSRWHAPPRGA